MLVAKSKEERGKKETEKEKTQIKSVMVDKLLPGMVLAETVKNDDGEILLEEGTTLTVLMIKALFQNKIIKVAVSTESYEKAQEESDGKGVEGVEFSDDDLISMGEEAAKEYLLGEEKREEELPEELREFYKNLLNVSEKNFEAIKNDEPVNLKRNRLLFVLLQGYLKESPAETMNLLRYRSRTNYIHSQAVNSTILAIYLGQKMGLERQKIMDIGLGTMFQNLGMTEFEELMGKKKPFTEAEKTMLRSHPVICEDKIKKIDSLNDNAASIIYQHHERLDGSGYPRGLSFGEISELTAIAMVAIEFVDLIQPRILSEKISAVDALEKIQLQSGEAFWEEPVDQLTEIVAKDFRSYAPGSLVELGEGEIAVVLEITEVDTKPVINIVVDKEGRPLEEPEKVNLKDSESNKYIKSVVHENIVEIFAGL